MRARDAIVVGAGAIGSCVALRLVSRGQRVLLLDAGMPGRRASGVGGGVLGAQSASAGPGPLFDLAMHSLGLYPRLAEELRSATGMDVGFRRNGVLELVFDVIQDAAAAARMQWQLAAGLPVERLDSSARDVIEPELSRDVLGAYHYPADGQVEPRALVSALSQAFVNAGGEIRAGAAVQRVLVEAGAVQGVVSSEETSAAPTVIGGAGAWSAGLEGAGLPAAAVAAVRGQAVELEQVPVPVNAVVTSRRGTIIPLADGRLLCGWTTEHAVDDDAPTVEGMLQILEGVRAMVPAVAQARLRDAWGGLRPATVDGLPLLGRGSAAGLYLAVAHDMTGLLFAPAMADVVTSLVLDAASPFDLAPWSPARFVS